MRIHHLNCASMHPLAGFTLEHWRARRDYQGLVCHCLLIETEAGLVLVDSGLGLADVNAGAARLGGMFTHVVRPALHESQTARRQVEALGFDPADVRHIVLTHLDVDHAGGLPDFPEAAVHVMATEHAAAQARRHIKERDRYRPAQWSHAPDWRLHSADGEAWNGFAAVRDLDGLPPEILMIPLAGHTRGHAGIVVQTDNGWLLHAGDAYFHRDEVNAAPHACPFGLRVFQWGVAVDNGRRARNQTRLRELAAGHDDIALVCSHDPVELAHMQG